jgi:pantothenate kinase
VAAVDDVAALVERARALVRGGRTAVLGVTGAPGAGKTTLAEQVVAALAATPPVGTTSAWVAHVPMDGFHLADVELARLGRAGRKGAPDTFDADGYAALLRRVRAGEARTVYAPTFDRVLEQPVAGAIPVHPDCRLVVSEGNYLLLADPAWAPVAELLDEVWFVEVDEPERLRRLVRRHEQFGKPEQAAREWVAGTDEPNARLVEATRSRADLVVRVGAAGRP